MKTTIIVVVILIVIIAALFDLKNKGLGYKLMPKPLKNMADRIFQSK